MLCPYRHFPDFSNLDQPNGNFVLNDLVLDAVNEVIRGHLISQFPLPALESMSYLELKLMILLAAIHLEFRGDVSAYLQKNPKKPHESVACFNLHLQNICSAFPTESDQFFIKLLMF